MPVGTNRTAGQTITAADINSIASLLNSTETEAANAKARANHTGTQSADTVVDSATKVLMTPAERTKLAGVATGATNNPAVSGSVQRLVWNGSAYVDRAGTAATTGNRPSGYWRTYVGPTDPTTLSIGVIDGDEWKDTAP